MKTDVAGRLRNVNLPITHCLFPLFEAIANSIDAIDEAKRAKGAIEVTVHRETDGVFPNKESLASQPVTGFTIIDNGIGFTDTNFDSFQTADTTIKASKGGKGIGRFLWLKAFDRAEVDSLHSHDGKTWQRQFVFSVAGNGVSKHSNKEVDSK